MKVDGVYLNQNDFALDKIDKIVYVHAKVILCNLNSNFLCVCQ